MYNGFKINILKDPLKGIEMNILWNDLTVGNHDFEENEIYSSFQPLHDLSLPQEWVICTNWQASISCENLGFLVRSLLAAYVHVLALPQDLLLTDLTQSQKVSPFLIQVNLAKVLESTLKTLQKKVQRML